MADPCIAHETTGYHGTSSEAARDIKEDKNFLPSDGDDKWLGPGVYFFEDGISNGKDDAKSWGYVAAWDNDEECLKYREYAVVKVALSMKKMLDLTTFEGLKFFEYARREFRGRARPKYGEPQSGRKFDNSVINFWASMLKFDGLRGWFFTKLSRDSRYFWVESGIPNTTIICIRDHATCISLDRVEIVANGSTNR
ncbi:hypothetical protein OJ996_09050 [Luteolibacter sp. GHJ8]|uniref:RES domain-containing protein n=1 Tax=Luteolibacter rhizosphaerae TaxID=2989719 RepID=A0ABT3G1J8_9BACT|nr:hypothetical protein [Luteolibacter rhizosphaerae]MCW1913720.1 hypothetical protein [Luteolibacter rhizosphaerae]